MIEMNNTSVAEVYRFIKQFHFESGYNHNPYTELTYSDTSMIRYSNERSRIVLKRQSDNLYPSGTDIWFRTWTTNPKACRRLLMLQIFPSIQPTYGEVYLRINNGTDDLYWDGGAWSIAGVGDWNTEAEINANIETFPILPDRIFAITVNLRTTDPRRDVTPYVTEIRVLMEVHIDYMEDIILRSLMPLMEGGITPVANFAAIPVFSTDVSTIDFSDYRINTPYNILDVEHVYDLTDDIDLLYNLFQSYDTNTGIITLSSDLPAGHTPLVIFRYVPEISYITHQDWIEVNKLPSIVIQRIEVPIAQDYTPESKEGIVDKGTGNAVLVHEPLRVSLEFRLHVMVSNPVDQLRLISKTLEFFKDNKFITSTGLDESYRMFIEREFRDITSPNKADESAFWTRFSIKDIRMPFKSTDEHAVLRTLITFKGLKPPYEDPLLGGSQVETIVNEDDAPVVISEIIEKT